MVPVRPDWSDSSDLFGHVDLNGKFIPGTIIDFVKRAELDSVNPYFLCLDEMNLARVEYYLSDFLSVIETRDFQSGHIVTEEERDKAESYNDISEKLSNLSYPLLFLSSLKDIQYEYRTCWKILLFSEKY